MGPFLYLGSPCFSSLIRSSTPSPAAASNERRTSSKLSNATVVPPSAPRVSNGGFWSYIKSLADYAINFSINRACSLMYGADYGKANLRNSVNELVDLIDNAQVDYGWRKVEQKIEEIERRSAGLDVEKLLGDFSKEKLTSISHLKLCLIHEKMKALGERRPEAACVITLRDACETIYLASSNARTNIQNFLATPLGKKANRADHLLGIVENMHSISPELLSLRSLAHDILLGMDVKDVGRVANADIRNFKSKSEIVQEWVRMCIECAQEELKSRNQIYSFIS